MKATRFGLLAAVLFAIVPGLARTAPGTITLGVEVTSASGGTVTPKVTWSTNPAAASCSATLGWSGAKPPSGNEILSPVDKATVYGLTCLWGSNSTVLSWEAPTLNTDGTALTNLGGYHLYVTDPNAQKTMVSVDKTQQAYTFQASLTGQYFFAIAAVTTDGIESPQSNQVQWSSSASAGQQTVSLGVKIPAAPTNLTAK